MLNPCFQILLLCYYVTLFNVATFLAQVLKDFTGTPVLLGFPWLNQTLLIKQYFLLLCIAFCTKLVSTFQFPVSQMQTSKTILTRARLIFIFLLDFCGWEDKKKQNTKNVWIVWLVLIFCSFAVVIQQCLLLVIMLLCLRERRGWWKDIWPIFLMLFPHFYMQHM